MVLTEPGAADATYEKVHDEAVRMGFNLHEEEGGSVAPPARSSACGSAIVFTTASS